MDVLAEVIGALDLAADPTFRATFRGPFAAEVPAAPSRIRFHLVVEGRCRVELERGPAVVAEAGDLVLVLHGAAHEIADAPGRVRRSLAEVLEDAHRASADEIDHGSGEPRLRLVCGSVSPRFPDAAGGGGDAARDALPVLLRALPSLLHVRAEEGRCYAWVDSLLDHLDGELRRERAGYRAILRRLSEIVLIEALRVGLDPDSPDAMPAFADPVVRRALEAIHAAPERPWTLGTLASRAGASRSVLAERFRRALGTSPMRYASRWRLERARGMLARRDLSIGQIAASVGYASPAAFNRAFKQAYGTPPGRLRTALLDGLLPPAG